MKNRNSLERIYQHESSGSEGVRRISRRVHEASSLIGLYNIITTQYQLAWTTGVYGGNYLECTVLSSHKV